MIDEVAPWSFYDPATGALTGRTYAGPESLLALNTPPGHHALKGHHDHLSKRVDLQSGAVVDWQPPQPSPDHQWDQQSRRWQLSASAQERQAARAEALERIAALEAAQHRAVRELLLELASEHPGLNRLQEIDTQIAQLREAV